MDVAEWNLLVIPINVLMINQILRRISWNKQRLIFLTEDEAK